jgi:hypothetical protein
MGRDRRWHGSNDELDGYRAGMAIGPVIARLVDPARPMA